MFSKTTDSLNVSCPSKISGDQKTMFERHRSATALERQEDPLSRCVELDYMDTLEELLEQKSWPQHHLDLLLVKACALGRTDACALLLRFLANPNAAATLPPFDATRFQDQDAETFTQTQAVARRWQKDHSPVDGSALHHAVYNGHLQVVQILLRHGANINARDRYGLTPLMLGVAQPETNKIAFLLMLHPNCQINLRDFRQQRTAIHYAVESGNFLATETLLSSGAETNAIDRTGTTALFLACGMPHTRSSYGPPPDGQLRCVRALLAAGAAKNNANSFGESPLYRAVMSENTKVATLLLEAGCTVDSRLLIKVCRDVQNVPLIRTIFRKGSWKADEIVMCGLILSLLLDEPSKWEVGAYEKEEKMHEIAKIIVKTMPDNRGYSRFIKCSYQTICDVLGSVASSFTMDHYRSLAEVGLCGFAFLQGKLGIAIMLHISGCQLDLQLLKVHPKFSKFADDPFFLAWLQGYAEVDPSSEHASFYEEQLVDNVIPYDANIHGMQERSIDTCYGSRENSKAINAAFMNIYSY